jgi:hypothetical protein
MRALAAQPSLSWVYAFVCAAYPRLDQFDGGQLNGMFEALPALAGDVTGSAWLDDLVQICCYELPARQVERAALAAAADGSSRKSTGLTAAPAAAMAGQRTRRPAAARKQQHAPATSNGKQAHPKADLGAAAAATSGSDQQQQQQLQQLQTVQPAVAPA